MILAEQDLIKLVEDRLHSQLKDLLLGDTGESIDQLKQFRRVGDLIKRARSVKGIMQDAAPDPGSFQQPQNSDEQDLQHGTQASQTITMGSLKSIIAQKVSNASSGEVSKNLILRLRQEAIQRAGKGFDLPAFDLPSIKPVISFNVLVDGVPVPNGKIEIWFELIFNVEAKGIVAKLEQQEEKTLSIESLTLGFRAYVHTPMFIWEKKTKLGKERKLPIFEKLEFKL